MAHRHYKVKFDTPGLLNIGLARQATVRFMDATNHQSFQDGAPYSFRGGLATESPYGLMVKEPGDYQLVIETNVPNRLPAATLSVMVGERAALTADMDSLARWENVVVIVPAGAESSACAGKKNEPKSRRRRKAKAAKGELAVVSG